MKLGRKWLTWLVTGALLGVVALLVLFGWGWRVELDVRSGRERDVTLFLGLPVINGAPRDTELSEWLGPPETGSHWINVASEHVNLFADVATTWCYDQILHHLHELESLKFAGDHKRQYAVLLLNELQTSESPCAVSTKCYEVGGQLLLARFQRPPEVDLFSKLMDFWTQKRNAQQVVPPNGP